MLTVTTLLCVMLIQALAATTEEIEEQIAWCKTVKSTAHQMAECARTLGYAEDHTIIKEAQGKWWEADAEEKRLKEDLAAQSEPAVPAATWTGSKLTRSKGVNYGPLGKETYYNLPMQGVINIMRRNGYDAERFPYWVRDDGVRMLGDYIMLAGRVGQFERGTIVQCSLGQGMICDYGYLEWNGVDVAVVW